MRIYSSNTIYPNVRITKKLVYQVDDENNKYSILCVQADISGHSSGDVFGRSNIKFNLRNEISDSSLRLYKTCPIDFSLLTFDSAYNSLEKLSSLSSVSATDELITKEIDITKLIQEHKSTNTFSIWFAVFLYGQSADIVIDDEFEIIGEVYNINNSYLHESITQDQGLFGLGRVDLFISSTNTNRMNSCS